MTKLAFNWPNPKTYTLNFYVIISNGLEWMFEVLQQECPTV